MKPSKSPEGGEVTPSKKKLKQARLPFKTISADSAKSSPLSRKRKLSTTTEESATKLGKICKENDIIEDPVVIIDDDSKDETSTEIAENHPNPYVKLVNKAWKKKHQKFKRSKKNKSSKNQVKDRVSIQSKSPDDKMDDCEGMEVDEPAEEINETNVSDNGTILKETENSLNNSLNEVSDNIVLDNLNNAVDVTILKANNSETKNDKNEVEKSSKLTNKVESKENTDKKSPVPLDSNTLEGEKLKAPITPKRSTRNKTKQEDNNNSKGSPTSSKLNESLTSSPLTPKQNKNNAVTKLDESMNGSTPSNNLTPKQVSCKTFIYIMLS